MFNTEYRMLNEKQTSTFGVRGSIFKIKKTYKEMNIEC